MDRAGPRAGDRHDFAGGTGDGPQASCRGGSACRSRRAGPRRSGTPPMISRNAPRSGREAAHWRAPASWLPAGRGGRGRGSSARVLRGWRAGMSSGAGPGAAASIWVRRAAVRDGGLRFPGGIARLRPGGPCRNAAAGDYVVTACFWSLLVTWMLRGFAASWTGMVRVSTPTSAGSWNCKRRPASCRPSWPGCRHWPVTAPPPRRGPGHRPPARRQRGRVPAPPALAS
jgi:hypothetical protein